MAVVVFDVVEGGVPDSEMDNINVRNQDIIQIYGICELSNRLQQKLWLHKW